MSRPVTATDRPPVTDIARAEAERRYPGWVNGTVPFPDGLEEARELAREYFIEGAEWAAGRAETTTEAAVGELLERMSNAVTRLEALRDEHWYPPERQRLHGKVEGVKLATSYVEEARGLLATAPSTETNEARIRGGAQ